MRSAVEKVMWVGRGAVFLVGLVTILVLAFVLVNAVLGATGGPSLSGKFNQVDPGARWAVGGAGEQAPVLEQVARRRIITEGFARVNNAGTFDPLRSKAVQGVVKPTGATNLYCFDLTFRPKIAVASPYIVNAADVATSTQPDGHPSPLNGACPSSHRDAAARTYASDGSDEAVGFDIYFKR